MLNSISISNFYEFLYNYGCIKRRIMENNLALLRKERGWSQQQLAYRSGVNVRLIQAYEQGQRDIGRAQVCTVIKLANALGCAMEELIGIHKKTALPEAETLLYCLWLNILDKSFFISFREIADWNSFLLSEQDCAPHI